MSEDHVPTWLTPMLDQRLALVRQAVEAGAGEFGIIMTTLSEPEEGSSPEVFERWERSCDNCGTYCPDPTPFYTGQHSVDISGVQVIVTFGCCGRCRDA